jgi:hypothetical protein
MQPSTWSAVLTRLVHMISLRNLVKT